MTIAEKRERLVQTDLTSKAMIEEEAKRRREKSERLRKLRESKQQAVLKDAKR